MNSDLLLYVQAVLYVYSAPKSALTVSIEWRNQFKYFGAILVYEGPESELPTNSSLECFRASSTVLLYEDIRATQGVMAGGT